METVQEFTYLGDRVSAGGGCEAAVTARTRCGWAKFRELLHGRRFPPKPERKKDGNFVMDRKIHGESNVWSSKTEKDLQIRSSCWV